MNIDFSKLKSIDIKDVIANLNSGSLLKTKQARYTGLGILAVLFFVAYLTYYFLPTLDVLNLKKSKVAAILEMQEKVRQLDALAQKSQADLAQAEVSYAELNRSFSVESELEDLYRQVSMMATSQGLVITSLVKDGEEPIYPSGQVPPNPPAQADPQKPLPQPLFYRIKIRVELAGTYSRYMRFREQLSLFPKSVNVDKEQISLVSGNNRGAVQVKAQYSTFRLPQRLATKAECTSCDSKPLLSALIAFFIPNADAQTPAPQAAVPANPPRANSLGLGSNEEVKLAPAQTGSKGAIAKQSFDRDPFSRSTSGMIEGARDPRVSPLVLAPPESYVVIGIITGAKVQSAIIRTDFKESFIVKVGDRIGNQGGVISRIDQQSVYLSQPNGDMRLHMQTPTGLGSVSSGDHDKPVGSPR
jgi:Tfp pilus assembly protein PilO